MSHIPHPLADEPPAPDAPDQVGERGFSLRAAILKPRTLFSFALAVVIVGLVLKNTDLKLSEIWAQMRTVNPALYLMGFVAFYATFPLRALRWRVLLRNAGIPIDEGKDSWASLPALTEYLGLSWFANCVVPAKLGDAYRGYLLKRNGNVSFSRTLGTIFAERLLDMIVLFALLVASGAATFGSHMPPATRSIFYLGAGLVVVIIIGLATMRYLSPLIRRLVPQRFQSLYEHFEAGTLGSLQPRSLPLLLPLTMVIWFGESLRLFFVIEALSGIHLGLPRIMFIALTSSLLTTVPATPGGLGLVESGIIGVLTSPLFAVPRALAGAVGVLDRVINYWSIVVFGLILYLVSKRK